MTANGLDLTILDYVYTERRPSSINPPEFYDPVYPHYTSTVAGIIMDEPPPVAAKLVHLDNQLELDDMFERHSLPRAMMPGERWLLGVQELTLMPTDVVGLVELRSTLGRAGMIAPPTFADPHFEGYLTLEMWNLNRYHAIWIEGGMKLFSLVKVLGYYVPDYAGRYQGQVGITRPKALSDPGA